jgi:hypothetical protein
MHRSKITRANFKRRKFILDWSAVWIPRVHELIRGSRSLCLVGGNLTFFHLFTSQCCQYYKNETTTIFVKNNLLERKNSMLCVISKEKMAREEIVMLKNIQIQHIDLYPRPWLVMCNFSYYN